jgi:hypothetical protein
MMAMGLPQPVRNKPPLPPGAERRRSERIELLAQVELRRHDDVAVLPTINVSAGGMLVGLEHGALHDVAVGEDVHIFLATDDYGEPIEVAMDATVVRVIESAGHPTAVAVMWSSKDPRAVGQLAKLLAHIA